MRFPSISPSIALLSTILSLPSTSWAEDMLFSTSLNPCSANSGFTATLFDVVFTPGNATVSFNINAYSSISEKVVAQFEILAYGYTLFNQTVNPCENSAFASLCPLNPGLIPIKSNYPIPKDFVSRIPSIAYGVPDLDGVVRAHITSLATGKQLACVEANLSNGKTVNLTGVQWAVAVVAGLALLASAITSGLGHSNTAAHVAANALSLFTFFQSQAIIGMTAVALPPIVKSWTQDFQWSMGIVRIDFMQNICTWYQRSTGGSPSTILSNLATASVQVQKRSLQIVQNLFIRGYPEIMNNSLIKRQSASSTSSTSSQQPVVVRGIERVGFVAGIEPTNIFLTGLGFFVAFVTIVAIGVAAFKGCCEIAVKAGWLKSDKFQDFRNGWKVVLKGILFRLVLIGYPQMCILCLWEFTMRDSAAEVVLALFYFVSMTLALVWAAIKVIRIAKRSVSLHRNPAYILYSDPAALNKWGFLYVQFRASAYYFILPVLVYIIIKAVFVAFAQGSPVAQAVGLVIVEAIYLIGVSILRPWMDKKTNTMNITIAAFNFLNAVFLLVFSNVFNQPELATGVMGVIFFVYNAVFALVLLLMVLISVIYAIISKNPDNRYQPMRDDRGSFIKSKTNLTTELDALGATARGDMKMKRDLDDDSDSFSSTSFGKHYDPANVALPPSANASSRHVNQYDPPPHSPIDPSTPFIPNSGAPRHGTPQPYGGGYSDNPYDQRNTPAPQHTYNAYNRSGSLQSNTSYRPQTQNTNNSAPWQRGAGYDH